MSLASNVANLATRIGTEFKAVRTTLGSLSSLSTTDKTSIVGAINEVKSAVGGAGAQINDAVTNGSTVWSGTKTSTSISDSRAALKAEILGGAGAAYDTFQELKALLDASDLDDDTALSGLTTAVGNRVRFDAAQTLTGPQKAQVLSNLNVTSAVDIGDTNTNFVTAFETALA